MNSSVISVALIQASCSEDIEQNVESACEKVKDAADNGAHLIIMQELFAWPYFCREVNDRHFNRAVTIPGPFTRKFEQLAAEHGVVIILPVFEKRGGGIYHNTCVILDADGSYLGKYRKMHIPEDPGFHEKYYFTPGDLGYQVFDTRYGRLGILICWDQWYPEAARINAMMGADLLIYPTAIASLPEEHGELAARYLDAWQTVQRSHAIANGCFVASVNRVGRENNLDFWGHSFVCGPFGEILAEGGQEEQTVLATIDWSVLDRHRTTWPFFRDRRIDTYQPLLNRWIDK